MHGLPCACLVQLSAQIPFLMPTCKARYHPWGPHISYPFHPKHWSPPGWWPLSIPVILVQALHCICCLSAIQKCTHLHSKTEINQNTYRELVHYSQKTVCAHHTDKSVKVIIMKKTQAKCLKLMQVESSLKSQQALLIMKFPAYYGTKRFIIVFTWSSQLSKSWSQINPVHVPGQFQCFPFQVVSYPQVVPTNRVYTSPVPHTSTGPAHLTPPSPDNSNNI